MNRKPSLPKLNQNGSKETDKVSLAIIDETSLKKIVSADRKTFNNVLNKNIKTVVSPFHDFFSAYKDETIGKFAEMTTTLDKILETFSNSYDLQVERDKFDKDQKLKENYQEAENQREKKSPPQPKEKQEKKEEDDKQSSFFKSLNDWLQTAALSALFLAKNPSGLGGMIAGGMGALGNMITKPLKSIIPFLTKRAGYLPALAEGYQAITGEDYTPDKRSNNSDFATGLGRFLGGNGNKEDGGGRLMHYLSYIGAGAQLGRGGGPWGMLAGAATGLAGGFASETIGPDGVADSAQLASDKLTSFLALFDTTRLDLVEIQRQIDEAKALIPERERQYNENVKQLVRLYQERDAAFASGDTARGLALETQIQALEDSNTKIAVDITLEKAKLEEKLLQLEMATKKTFFDKVGLWLDSYGINTQNAIDTFVPGMALIDDKTQEGLFKSMALGLTNVKNWIVGATSGLFSSVEGAYTATAGALSTSLDTLKTNIISFYELSVGKLEPIFKGFMSDISNWFSDTFDWNKFMKLWYGEGYEDPLAKQSRLRRERAEPGMVNPKENDPLLDMPYIYSDELKKKNEQLLQPFGPRPGDPGYGQINGSLAPKLIQDRTVAISELGKLFNQFNTGSGGGNVGVNTVNNNNTSSSSTNIQNKTVIATPLSTNDMFFRRHGGTYSGM